MVRVIFGKNNLPFSILIRVFTWSRWSHVGIVIGGYVYEAKAPEGVVKTPIDEFCARYTETHQAYLPGEVDIDWMEAQLGKKYDWMAVFGLGIRHQWNHPDRWFCMEYLAGACKLWRSEYIGRITPQDGWIITKDE